MIRKMLNFLRKRDGKRALCADFKRVDKRNADFQRFIKAPVQRPSAPDPSPATDGSEGVWHDGGLRTFDGPAVGWDETYRFYERE